MMVCPTVLRTAAGGGVPPLHQHLHLLGVEVGLVRLGVEVSAWQQDLAARLPLKLCWHVGFLLLNLEWH